MNIYVANLSFDLRDEDLKQFFIAYGEVTSAKIIMDKTTDRSRGFGFVEMADEAAGRKAIAGLDGTTVDNRAIKVNEAKPKPGNRFTDRGDRNYNNSQSFNKTMY